MPLPGEEESMMMLPKDGESIGNNDGIAVSATIT
jgi:hypothetical protein